MNFPTEGELIEMEKRAEVLEYYEGTEDFAEDFQKLISLVRELRPS